MVLGRVWLTLFLAVGSAEWLCGLLSAAYAVYEPGVGEEDQGAVGSGGSSSLIWHPYHLLLSGIFIISGSVASLDFPSALVLCGRASISCIC